MKLIDGKKYYSIEEAAMYSKLSVRTLRRYLSDGRLSDFIYPFRTGPNEVLYRLEEPDKTDVKNKKGEWMISLGDQKSVNDGIHSERRCYG